MTCDATDPNIGYGMRRCDRPAEWVFQALALGYPSNETVLGQPRQLCPLHLIGFVAASAAGWDETVAGFRVVRTAHYRQQQQVRELRGT